MGVSVFKYGNGKVTEWHESNTDIRPKVIVKDGAAVTKAGGAGNVPEGGDVRDERRRWAKVFHEGAKIIVKMQNGADVVQSAQTILIGREQYLRSFWRKSIIRERDA
jgi:hypothetical protein